MCDPGKPLETQPLDTIKSKAPGHTATHAPNLSCYVTFGHTVYPLGLVSNKSCSANFSDGFFLVCPIIKKDFQRHGWT